MKIEKKRQNIIIYDKKFKLKNFMERNELNKQGLKIK